MNDTIRLKIKTQRPRVVLINPDPTVADRLERWGFVDLRRSMEVIPLEFEKDEALGAISRIVMEP